MGFASGGGWHRGKKSKEKRVQGFFLLTCFFVSCVAGLFSVDLFLIQCLIIMKYLSSANLKYILELGALYEGKQGGGKKTEKG